MNISAGSSNLTKAKINMKYIISEFSLRTVQVFLFTGA